MIFKKQLRTFSSIFFLNYSEAFYQIWHGLVLRWIRNIGWKGSTSMRYVFGRLGMTHWESEAFFAAPSI